MTVRSFFLGGLLLLWPLLAAAAPLTRDLGDGLRFHRARSLPADLPAGEAGSAGALVLDLRYAGGDAAGATALSAWLNFRASRRSPVYVLANADTGEGLRAVLERAAPGSGVLVIGASSAGFRPGFPVTVTAEADRRAYLALEEGVETAVLLTDQPGKVRNDEASLARDRVAPADDAGAVRPPPLPVDLVLQRAVHLHRGLRALKKL